MGESGLPATPKASCFLIIYKVGYQKFPVMNQIKPELLCRKAKFSRYGIFDFKTNPQGRLS